MADYIFTTRKILLGHIYDTTYGGWQCQVRRRRRSRRRKSGERGEGSRRDRSRSRSSSISGSTFEMVEAQAGGREGGGGRRG